MRRAGLRDNKRNIKIHLIRLVLAVLVTGEARHENEWIKASPGKGWFTYFRIYGPEAPAFDKSWKPGDFEEGK